MPSSCPGNGVKGESGHADCSEELNCERRSAQVLLLQAECAHVEVNRYLLRGHGLRSVASKKDVRRCSHVFGRQRDPSRFARRMARRVFIQELAEEVSPYVLQSNPRVFVLLFFAVRTWDLLSLA